MVVYSKGSRRYVIGIDREHKHRTSEIKAAIVSALLESTASESANGRAIYRTAAEQAKRLTEAWEEWGHVFTDAGRAVSPVIAVLDVFLTHFISDSSGGAEAC